MSTLRNEGRGDRRPGAEHGSGHEVRAGAQGPEAMPQRPKPIASLSLDADNQWSYMKIHGDDGWESFPSYLDVLAPRALEVLARHDLRITFFVVGQDAALPENRDALGAIAQAGHEIGNHSFRHEPWLHRYSETELDEELERAEAAIEAATGVRTDGFRGPGYSLSETTLQVLVRRGYSYDASTLPTYIGPLARAYYFRTAKLTAAQRAERELLYGTWSDGRRAVRPYRWAVGNRTLLELPVTTLPGLKVPIHLSYLLMLSAYSPAAARSYFGAALRVCRAIGVGPSILMHPLDVISGDDVKALAFFPGMQIPAEEKVERVHSYLDLFRRHFEVVPVGAHARALEARDLPVRAPTFAAAS
jgi:peptidoglycan-N-acetylglucosamine deacetylase